VSAAGLRSGACARALLARFSLVALAFLALAGCATAPPRDIDDLCRIFAEQPGWRRAAERAESRWGTKVPVAMAFVRHESSFRADAKPPRTRILGLIPWTRPSSAYGYAQATDEAWEDYLGDTGHWFVSRTDFDDSIDFIGWYNDRSRRRLSLRPDDTYNLYLAYHEGHGGYAAGTWREKAWLRRYAQTVADRARKYGADLARCPGG
jgi:hypothetical protein